METINEGGWRSRMPENPEDRLAIKWGLITVITFVFLIVWAITPTTVLLQTAFGIFCLAIAFGKITITEQPDYAKLFNEEGEYNA